jgi:ACS family hexuronate transporter-like MFS transporter
MSAIHPDLHPPARSRHWKWWVCGLLLLATTVNYMDRQTLSQMAVRIQTDFGLSDQDYGWIESAFALAFAFGALLMGWLADRINVRWLYPAAVLVWSAAGFVTGFAQGFASLLICRFFLGLAESGNWPCALRTTQRILPPEERTMGNGILQSGAAVGAILTPLVVLGLVRWTDTWRYPFLVIGVLGIGWTVLWLISVHARDLALPAAPPPAPSANGSAKPLSTRPTGLVVRRFVALMILVVTINAAWHFFRAWLPKILQQQHGYSEGAVAWFTAGYYLATDLGSLSAGFATLYLCRRGLPVHWSRVWVFLTGALLVALSIPAAFVQSGPLLLVLFLVIGFGALAVFPNYYSFSQELTVRHQGKVTGVLGFCCWMAMAAWHPVIGHLVGATGSYKFCMILAGLFPLVGFLALVLLWGPTAPVKLPAPVALPPAAKAVLTEERILAALPAEPAVRPGTASH